MIAGYGREEEAGRGALSQTHGAGVEGLSEANQAFSKAMARAAA